MIKNKQLLSPLKEEEDPIKKDQKKLKRGNSLVQKKLLTKKSLRYSVDLKTVMQKKFVFQKNTNPLPVDLCLYALNSLPKQRNNESLQHIISYLKSLPSFMNIISKEKNLKISENLIEQISVHLRHEFIPKNNLVCRYGEKGEKFYIILKGRVNFLIPKPSKCYLNLEEYIVYLMQLRKNNEFELINNLLVQNRISYPIEDDDFDSYILREYERYLKKTGRKIIKSKTKIIPNHLISNKLISLNNDNKEDYMPNIKSIYNINKNVNKEYEKDKKVNNKKMFSLNTYKKMEDVVERINHPKYIFNEGPFTGENSPKHYMKSNNVADTQLESKGRKLVNIYNYEEMSSFENGQTFGFIALQSKNSKRAATAIVVEDSNLGVLTKDEYSQFFEIMSNKEKKNLYELLKFYNLITTVSEYKFIKRYYHMFEYIKFHKNNTIMETTRKINELIVFNSGLFVVNIFMNIPELNELITKLKLIRGKLLGLSRQKVEAQLDEKRENQDIIMRKNYISPDDNKTLIKRYNYTLSIISDHLIVGYPDTVDPVTNLPLFNCTCLSAESDGYVISNRSIKLINEESVVIHNLKDFCLMKIDYNLNRLQQFKKEIFSKSKKNNEISSPKKENILSVKNISTKYNNKERSFSDSKLNGNNLTEDKTYYVERNQITRKKGKNNNKILIALKFNSNIIENALNKYNINKNEENKNNKEKDRKLLTNNHQGNVNIRSRNKSHTIIKNNINNESNQSKTYVINKLRESIMEKQKKIELKKEQYYKTLEDINNNKKEKMNKKEKYISINTNTMKDIENIYNDTISNQLKSSVNQDYLESETSKTQQDINKNKINSVNSISYKIINPFKNKEKLLTLPPVDNKNNKISNSNYSNMKLITEPQQKIKNMEIIKRKNNLNNYDFSSYENIFKKTSLSPSYVKEKYIIFKSPNNPIVNNLNTEKNDYKSKIKLLKHINTKKDNHKNYGSLNDLEYDNNKFDKNIEYINIVSPTMNNITNKKNSIDNDINQKYKELNVLVKSLQKTTNEILDKKII